MNINDVVISTEGSVAKEVDWNNPIVDGKTEGQLAVDLELVILFLLLMHQLLFIKKLIQISMLIFLILQIILL